jgi:hypothetical protein
MPHPKIELRHYWQEEDVEARQRIEQLLAGAEHEKEMATRWYDYLQEQLNFPFYAYIKLSDFTATTSRHIRVKLTRLADKDRCGFRMIWLEGYPTTGHDNPYFFFLADFQSIETDMIAYQAVQDYLYWDKYLKT